MWACPTDCKSHYVKTSVPCPSLSECTICRLANLYIRSYVKMDTRSSERMFQNTCQSWKQAISETVPECTSDRIRFYDCISECMWGILSEARMMSAYMSDWCQIKSYVNGCDWGSHGSQAFDMFRIRLACLGWWQIAGQKGHVGWCQKSQIWCLRLVRVQVKSLSGFISCHFLIFFVFVSAS